MDHYAEKIFKVFSDALSCDVTISLLHRHKRRGKIFHVNIRVLLPWGEVNVNREPEKDHAHENLAVALKDAFSAARRMVEDEVRIRRGFVKAHEERHEIVEASSGA
ncbi:MAG: hypothetical protein ACXVB9_07020 [Bdellovibrionota bacterium]